MTKIAQGDIFQAASRVQLVIVFGHLGFNEMRQCWEAFKRNKGQLSQIQDPFMDLAGRAVEWVPGKWLWFVPEEQNHGMTETQLANALDGALAWASQNSIGSVATNGIANTDHGNNTADNRRSDEQRAAWLEDYARKAEQRYRMAIQLISMNDVFVRNRE